jgi:hypothetical protein
LIKWFFILQEPDGKIKTKHTKGSGYFMKSISSVDVKLMALVGEVTKSKDETIAAKNYAIQLLETMLQKSQKTCGCE